MHDETPRPHSTDGRPGGGRIVVGVDGSPGSRDALAFALVAAARRGAGVEVVSTYPLPLPWAGGRPSVVPDPTALRTRLEATVRGIVEAAQQHPVVLDASADRRPAVTWTVSEGPAGPVLLERSRDADLLVVGSRGRGALRSALLGSVALHCAAGAACPVLVVPPGCVPAGGPPVVVVGIDGSEHARAALGVALAEAARLGAAVEAVAAYDPTGRWTELDEQVVPSFEGIRADVQHGAEKLVEEVLADAPGTDGAPAPEVRVVVVESSPAEALIGRSRAGQLLVVGSRGHGGIRGLLLGSVALRCLASAECPVLVVHARSGRPDAPADRAGSAAVRS